MKKIFALMLVVSVSAASSAFAAYGTGDVTIGSTSTAVIKTSKNVYIDYAAGALGAGYAAVTYHNKGTKTYGSSSGDAKVYENAATGASVPTAPVGTASAAWGTTWTAL